MKASNQPGGSLRIDGEFMEERMIEHGRLHNLFKERVASKTPYITKELLKDARNLLELDLILLVGSDLTWDKTQRVGGVAPRTNASQTRALIRPPQAASGGGVNNDEDSNIMAMDPLEPKTLDFSTVPLPPTGLGFAKYRPGFAYALVFFFSKALRKKLMTPMLRYRVPPFKVSTRHLPLPKTTDIVDRFLDETINV